MSEFIDNSAQIIAKLRKAANEAVSEIAAEIVETAAQLAPKKTGELAASYTHEKTGFAAEKVGSTLDRAIFTELGTTKQPPQPHFLPACEMHGKELPNKIIEKFNA